MELRCTICRVQGRDPAPGDEANGSFGAMRSEPAALTEAVETYGADPETRRLARAAAQVEAAGYCRWPRVQEVMEFARRIGAARLGIASCTGLMRESDLLREILEANGFEVSAVCCKVGSIPKESHRAGRSGEGEAGELRGALQSRGRRPSS